MSARKKRDSHVSLPKPGRQRAWTGDEERWLIRHRNDGADLIAHALGRTQRSVVCKAARLHVSLATHPGDVCPLCGVYEIRPKTASARHGMCPVCWERAKRKAMEERAAMSAEQVAYNAAKQRVKYNADKLAALHDAALSALEGRSTDHG